MIWEINWFPAPVDGGAGGADVVLAAGDAVDGEDPARTLDPEGVPEVDPAGCTGALEVEVTRVVWLGVPGAGVIGATLVEVAVGVGVLVATVLVGFVLAGFVLVALVSAPGGEEESDGDGGEDTPGGEVCYHRVSSVDPHWQNRG